MFNLFVLTGGSGLEREVSINSAHYFVEHIDINVFNVFLMNLSKDGFWTINEEICYFLQKNEKLFAWIDNHEVKVDYIFPIIHGEGAENGALQGYFDSLKFYGVIANTLSSSSISFDKIFSKNIAQILNIPVVPYIDYYYEPTDFFRACDKLNAHSLFLKPADNGSSFGCIKVSNASTFDRGIKDIQKISKFPLVEKNIDSMIECSCSVLYGEVSQVICINHNAHFFSYQSKYLDHKFTINFLEDDKLVKLIQEYSQSLFRSMKLNLMGRFDYFICVDSNTIFFNEVNSLPGLGPNSLFFSSFSKNYSKHDLVAKILNDWIANNSIN